MPTIPRILATTALCLAALGLSSCTVITTGFWLDEIGQLRPEVHQASERRQVYRNSDYVYVQIPIVFVQNKQPVIRHINIIEMWDNVIPYMYPINKYPEISGPENYFLQIPSSYVKRGGIVAALDAREKHRSEIRLLSEKEVNITTCIRLQDERVYCPDELLTSQRTWGNQLRRPLAWCCMVIDIPLSIIATPVGWIVDVVSYPFSD